MARRKTSDVLFVHRNRRWTRGDVAALMLLEGNKEVFEAKLATGLSDDQIQYVTTTAIERMSALVRKGRPAESFYNGSKS